LGLILKAWAIVDGAKAAEVFLQKDEVVLIRNKAVPV
jgi:hypothetical protein